MTTLTIAEWKSLIQNRINVLLGSYGSSTLFDFVVGSLADTVTMVMAYLTWQTWQFFSTMVDQAFINTSMDVFLERHADTFDVPVSAGAEATGPVTFSRTGSVGALTIPAGTEVGTSSETIIGVAFSTDADATIPDGSSSITANITANDVGTKYNVEAGTIRYLLSPVVGISSITNSSATSGGTNADTNGTLRAKVMGYIQNIGKATKASIEYRATAVDGVEDAVVKELPFRVIETHNIDEDLFSYTGTWTNVSDDDFYWGEYIHTTTDTDYVEFYVRGSNYVIPMFGHTPTSTKFEVFLDGASKYIMDAIGDGVKFDGLRVTLPDRETHIIKIVKNSGADLIVAGMKVYSNEERTATIDVYVNDGSGSASWSLMQDVHDSVENYRAAGIRAFIKRSEIKVIDISIGISWTQNADKATCKDNIEADLSEYLTQIKNGATVYINNLYQFVSSQKINDTAQVKNSIISIPSANVKLAENEIARIGTVTFYEL